MDFHAVMVQKEWVSDIKLYLEGLKHNEDNRITARQCLEEFDTIELTMEVMKIDWAQGVFTTQQMTLIKYIATYLEMYEAERRFTL